MSEPRSEYAHVEMVTVQGTFDSLVQVEWSVTGTDPTFYLADQSGRSGGPDE